MTTRLYETYCDGVQIGQPCASLALALGRAFDAGKVSISGAADVYCGSTHVATVEQGAGTIPYDASEQGPHHEAA